MEVIVPQFVGAEDFSGTRTMAELLSSSISAPTEDTWSSSTTYATDDLVKYQITTGTEQGIWKIFKSLQDSNTDNNPYTSTTYWSDQGATEQYKMFDYYAGTVSTDSANDIVINLHCKSINAIAFMNVQASNISVKVYKGSDLTDKIEANLLQEVSISLIQKIYDWYEYFFEDFDYVRDVSVPIDIYLFHNVVLEITFTKMSGEDCYVGQCLPGRLYNLGDVEYGANTDIKDYSRVETDDDYGYTYLSQGSYKKTMEVDIVVENDDLNKILNILTQLRAVPTVWQANPTGAEWDDLLIYGFIRRRPVTHSFPNNSEISIEIEGLI